MALIDTETAAQTQQRRTAQLDKARLAGNAEKVARLEGKLATPVGAGNRIPIGTGPPPPTPAQVDTARTGAGQPIPGWQDTDLAKSVGQGPTGLTLLSSTGGGLPPPTPMPPPADIGGAAGAAGPGPSAGASGLPWTTTDQTGIVEAAGAAGPGTPGGGTGTTGTGLLNSVLPPGATIPPTKNVTPLADQYTTATGKLPPLTAQTAPGAANTYTPAQAEAAQATATPFAVTPEQTVESRIAGLIGSDSPLMQQAARRAQGRANDRGLLNSSMAIQSGQQAVYDTALPIASQDAAAFERAATATAQAQNVASLTNANLSTNVNLNNSAAINTALSKASDFMNQERLDLALATIAQETQLNVADRNNLSAQIVSQGNNDTKLFVESMGNIATFAGQVLNAQTLTDIADLDNDTRLLLENLSNTNSRVLQDKVAGSSIIVTMLNGLGDINRSGMDSEGMKAARDTLFDATRKTIGAYADVEDLEIGDLVSGNAGGGADSGASGEEASGETVSMETALDTAPPAGAAMTIQGGQVLLEGKSIGSFTDRKIELFQEVRKKIGGSDSNDIRFKVAPDTGLWEFWFEDERLLGENHATLASIFEGRSFQQ